MQLKGFFTFLLLISCLWSSLQSFAQGNPINSAPVIYLSAEENQFFQIINAFRTQLGLPLLQIHLFLQNASVKHSQWMAAQDTLTHYGPAIYESPFQRMKDEGYVNFSYVGENIACGNGDAIKTFQQWAFSPGHLANLINPHYHHMGISRAGDNTEHCPFYWTNDFGSITDLSFDPPEVTELQKITAAIIHVSGPIPIGKTVQLTTAPPSPPVEPRN